MVPKKPHFAHTFPLVHSRLEVLHRTLLVRHFSKGSPWGVGYSDPAFDGDRVVRPAAPSMPCDIASLASLLLVSMVQSVPQTPAHPSFPPGPDI